MTRYAFYFDSTRCVDCKTCQVACKLKNNLPAGAFYRHVHSFEAGAYPSAGMYHVSMSCNHCENPACVAKCPTGAMYVSEDATVQHDDEVCIGCQMCVQSCPYGAPVYLEEKKIVGKCNACMDTRSEDGSPTCVASCGMRALDFGLYEELMAKHPEATAELACLPEPETSPSVLIDAREIALDADYRELLL